MDTLEKALAFLREHNEAAFATVEDGKLDYYDLTPTPPLFEHYECETAH